MKLSNNHWDNTEDELIAKFMGGRISIHGEETRYYFEPKGFRGSGWWDVNNLAFNSSWDWIIPVWCKFRDIDFPENSESQEKHSQWITSLQWYLFSSDEPKRFAERLVYAIKWYNTQKL